MVKFFIIFGASLFFGNIPLTAILKISLAPFFEMILRIVGALRPPG
jgi:hypothetical protein